jgi:hypothetical protein
MYGKTILSLLCMAVAMFPANIVTDGTFEAGGGAWSTTGAGSVVNLPGGCLGASDYCGKFGPTPFGTISQFVPTVSGAAYTVSFWLRSTSQSTAGPDNAFHFQWGNLIPLATEWNDTGGFDWTFFTTNVVADSSSMWVSFQGYNNTGTFLLDNITVEGPDGSVPEPSTWALACAGVACLWMRRRAI